MAVRRWERPHFTFNQRLGQEKKPARSDQGRLSVGWRAGALGTGAQARSRAATSATRWPKRRAVSRSPSFISSAPASPGVWAIGPADEAR